MRPFLTLFFEDLTATARSMVVWTWMVITIVAGISSVVVAKAFTDPTSFIFSWAVYLYIALGSIVVIAICAGATSGELPYLGNAIISRGVTPAQYVLAKLFSRLTAVLTQFVLVVFPVAFIMMLQGSNNDMVDTGIILGMVYIGLMLSLLAMLGVAFSAVITNLLLAVSLLSIIWYIGLSAYVLNQAKDFTPDGVLGQLPFILQGSFTMSENWPIIGYLSAPLVLLPILAIYFFSARDL